MLQPWTRLKFYIDDTCFSRDLTDAQAHDPSLKAVRVVASEIVWHEYIGYEVVELLAEPKLVAVWRLAVSEQRTLEDVAARHIQARTRAVLWNLPGAIPF